MGNIEFAVEINTSLIAQVRQLQAVVSERDEALKAANLEKSRLEAEAEGFAQRIKSMDESEQRYKDENWNLETLTHEMIAAAKEATGREQKLQQLLASTTAEKSAADRELDELKQNHGRLMEDITVVRKNHDVELAALRKNVNQGETEKTALKRKVEELTTQNQELAKAITARFRDAEAEAGKDVDPEPEDLSREISDPELSPPPSPTKGVPRHTMLESETLKSSLHHAHRMIQNLKGNIHREKTEKSDLKRMLQEARDELEVRKKELGSMNSESKKSRLKPQQEFNKKIRSSMLGAGRESKIHIMPDDDAEWEEHDGEQNPYRDEATISQKPNKGIGLGHITDMSDAYQTANETEDAFETANEQESATENEGYQPGVRGSPVESNDELTETEAGPARGRAPRGERPSLLVAGKAGDRLSYQSTASTSGDEDEQSSRTPVQQPQKYRLKIHRGPRRSRISTETMDSSTPTSVKNSPASFVANRGQEGQSLFAELGDLNAGESGEDVDGTPTKGRTPLSGSISSTSRHFGREKSISSLTSSDKSTPGIVISSSSLETPPLPRRQLVDSATMTDPWEPVQNYFGQKDTVNTRSNELSNDDPFVSKSVSADPGLRSLHGSDPAESSAGTSAWPKILDQPLGTLSNMIFNFGNTSESTPFIGKEGPQNVHTLEPSDEVAFNNQTSQKLAENKQDLENFHTTHPRSIINSSTSPVGLPPTLSISSVQSVEIAPSITSDVTYDLVAQTPSSLLPTVALNANPNLAGKPDVERIINTIFGSNTNTIPSASYLADIETGREVPKLPQRDGRRPRPGSAFNFVEQPKVGVIQDSAKPIPADVADQSSQTLLSSDQIDRILLLNDKALNLNSHKATDPPIIEPIVDVEAASPPVFIHRPQDSKDVNKGKQVEPPNRDSVPSVRVPRRPLSSASMRSRNGQYPPLPPDHQQAIAAAAQKVPSLEPSTGSMGPPLAPASAYRTSAMRPQTPSRSRTSSQQPVQSPASKNGTTPRVRHSTSKSQMSRRSSVSSFASELDERFNIRVDNIPGPYGLQSGTDPRMIQAITQTMIGEYLWKYTRKAGRGDMSSNRHRRFFWVHPYTRTLYWSGKDPAIARRAELKAKSVGIEAVQVVVDDNPMPPGLHRKSLVIYTPGRSIKLTATTGQRHETWFNALSYLLLRANPEGAPPSGADGTGITPEDIEDFNPSLSRGTSRATISRISLSSFRNASSQRSFNQRAQANLEARKPQIAHSSVASRRSHQAAPYYGSTSSRWSQYLKHGASVRGSVSSRTSHAVVPNEQGDSSQYANMVQDSAEDLRQVIEQQEREADQLENVRACCDGSSSFLHSIGFLTSHLPIAIRTFTDPINQVVMTSVRFRKMVVINLIAVMHLNAESRKK